MTDNPKEKFISNFSEIRQIDEKLKQITSSTNDFTDMEKLQSKINELSNRKIYLLSECSELEKEWQQNDKKVE